MARAMTSYWKHFREKDIRGFTSDGSRLSKECDRLRFFFSFNNVNAYRCKAYIEYVQCAINIIFYRGFWVVYIIDKKWD